MNIHPFIIVLSSSSSMQKPSAHKSTHKARSVDNLRLRIRISTPALENKAQKKTVLLNVKGGESNWI